MGILHPFIIGIVYTEGEVQSILWKMSGDLRYRLTFALNITVKVHMGKLKSLNALSEIQIWT